MSKAQKKFQQNINRRPELVAEALLMFRTMAEGRVDHNHPVGCSFCKWQERAKQILLDMQRPGSRDTAK